MLRKFKPFQASPRIEFKDPDTGRILRAATLQALYQDIGTYREQNQLAPIDALKEVVENYLCGLPENANRCCPAELRRGWMVYIKGGMMLLKNVVMRERVTMDVAEARAAQCVECPHNVFPDKDVFMAWSDRVAADQIGEMKTSRHEALGNCEVCTCVLKSKVFQKNSINKFSPDQLVKLRAVNCWQLKLSGQDDG